MKIPEQLLFTSTHEWVAVEGSQARIGITAFAADQLADIVLVSLPKVGQSITAGEPFGEIESVKSVEDVNSPLSGTVIAVNGALDNTPDLVNQEPFGEGWMIQIELADEIELENLLSPSDYRELLAQEGS
jgi:glycine cleavage system H protein